jgi:hypothetical protein
LRPSIPSAVLALTSLPLAFQLVAQDPRLAARLAPGPRVAIQHLVDSAASAGLPTEPLIRKALEGESKGADSARIVAAVQGLFTHLSTARQLFGPAARESELVAAAAALRAGASPSRLARLSSLRPKDQLTVPLSVLADLLASGIPVEQAWTSVYEMASHGATDAAFLALRDRLTGPDARGSPGMPPPAEHPPTAPLPGTERSP